MLIPELITDSLELEDLVSIYFLLEKKLLSIDYKLQKC